MLTRNTAICRFFPKCVAKGSRFTFGGLGADPCSRDPAFGVRNRSQQFATVRNCPQPFACGRRGRKVAVPMGKAAITWLFWRVRSCGHVVLRGRRGTWWHSNMFQDVSKIVLCGRLLLHFQKMCCIFRASAALWTPPMSFCVAGAALWTCRVAVFLRIALSTLREVVTRCKFRGRRGSWWHVMKIDGCLARKIDFAVGP